MCVAHGKPCFIMHGPFETYKNGSSHSAWGGNKILFVGAARRRRKGKEKLRKGKEKGRKRKEKERRKEKKKGEEERKKKEEKEGVFRSEQTRTAKNPELFYKR